MLLRSIPCPLVISPAAARLIECGLVLYATPNCFSVNKPHTPSLSNCFPVVECLLLRFLIDDYDDVCYNICWRLKLEGETENMGVCTKERKGVAAEVLMATPCTNSLGGESVGQKHEG